MLDAETVAIADEHRVHIVPLARGRMTTLDGPFARVKQIMHSPDGHLVVWDDSLYAAFVLDDDGDERRTVPFTKLGIGGGEVSFVALLAGDVGLFEEVDPGNPFSPTAGPSRNPVRYTTIAPDRTTDTVWTALGKERVVHRLERGMASAPVIFGYEVLATHAGGDRFVVAQTDEEEAIVLSSDGTRVGTVPMPSFGPAVSQDQIDQERARLIASQGPGRAESIFSNILPAAQVREAMAAMNADRIEALRAAPANSIPPRISDVRVDSGNRVWMRRFVPPGGHCGSVGGAVRGRPREPHDRVACGLDRVRPAGRPDPDRHQR